MNRYSRTGSGVRLLCGILSVAALFGSLPSIDLRAQGEPLPLPFVYDADNPVISLKVGPIYTNPEGDFPSLLIGESLAGSGEIPAAYGETGNGFRLGLEGFFPFGHRAGLLIEPPCALSPGASAFAAGPAGPGMRGAPAPTAGG